MDRTEADDEGGFSPVTDRSTAAADTSLLPRDENPRPTTTPTPTPAPTPNGWDPIPWTLLAYYCAAGSFFVTFNVWDMPALPFPLIGNLLAGTGHVQVPETQGYINMAFWLLLFWGLHFLRRFFEVMFVHTYTHTMSTVECVGVVVYYSLFGTWIGWSTNIFLDYFPPTSGIFALGIIVFLVGEIGNCFCHFKLKSLRSNSLVSVGTFSPTVQTSQPSVQDHVVLNSQPPPASEDHVTPAHDQSASPHVEPSGCLFAHVSCPHYLFEVITWLGFAIAAFTLASFVFLVASTVTLCVYARRRHAAYKQDFSDYPEKRKAIVPFIF